MKKECTEQDLQRLVQDAKLAFEDVTLTELDEDTAAVIGRTTASWWTTSCATGR